MIVYTVTLSLLVIYFQRIAIASTTCAWPPNVQMSHGRVGHAHAILCTDTLHAVKRPMAIADRHPLHRTGERTKMELYYMLLLSAPTSQVLGGHLPLAALVNCNYDNALQLFLA